MRASGGAPAVGAARLGYGGIAGYRAVRATRGSPARVCHAGQYAIWYWPENLLNAIRHQGGHLSGGQS